MNNPELSMAENNTTTERPAGPTIRDRIGSLRDALNSIREDAELVNDATDELMETLTAQRDAAIEALRAVKKANDEFDQVIPNEDGTGTIDTHGQWEDAWAKADAVLAAS